MICVDYKNRAAQDMQSRDRLAHYVSECCAYVVVFAYLLGVLYALGGVR